MELQRIRAPQSFFAMETHIERIASELSIDPVITEENELP
jgi:CO/xanthine dehydrogenase Mo-binding subunit